MAEKAEKPIPDGMHTLTVQLWFDGNCREAVNFYQGAFGTDLTGMVVPTPDGKGVWHAMLNVGDSKVMMADAVAAGCEKGPADHATAGLWMYVEDCDATFERARQAGCEVLMPMQDAFWGDRMGRLKDPFGHCWSIASRRWNFTPQEMQQRKQECADEVFG